MEISLNAECRKQWWSAQLALNWPMFHAITDAPSDVLPFMSSRRDRKCLCCSFLLYGVSLCMLCSHFCADLLFFVSAWLRITVQSLHSLKGPPISRLSAPLSLPCAFTVFPLSPCSVVCVILLLAGFLSCCPFFLSWLLL